MDLVYQGWLTALLLGIIAGAIFGLVSGHKLKDPMNRAITSPMIFQKGPTSTILIGISLVLMLFAFDTDAGVIAGVVALIIGYVTNLIVGSKVSHNQNSAGYSTAIRTIVIMSIVLCLPVGLLGYQAYNRAPNDNDKASFIYECSQYAANDIFRGEFKGDTGEAKIICGCMWPDLVGKYGKIGAIDSEVKTNDGKYYFGDASSKIYNNCVKET